MSTPKPFKLKPQRESRAKTPDVPEYIQEAHTFNYINTLRTKGVVCWKNEEFLKPGKRHDRPGNKFRMLASDILGVSLIGNGRAIAIEMKKKSEYDYIFKHYEILKNYLGQDAKKTRYSRQIHFIEMMQKHGAIAMFAYVWTQVKERFESEGIA
jgi:hypothetical protein